MLIRSGGYNTGAQEYLEKGTKAGREYSRDELDERVIIDGDLDLTRMIYESIPDRGQDRYLTFTMGFREDTVSDETLQAVTLEFKQFLMYAYKDDEFNFYAEAHLPKIKQVTDKKTGKLIERKPHIHVVIPRKNLLSGNEANPVGVYMHHEKYFEAFQEYLNQKYGLTSPREHIRFDPSDAASVLSRYKGDDFYGKNRDFKQELVKQVMERGVTSRHDFYTLVATHGETRIRNAGKESEYIAVKLPGDAKYTNLKDSIFHDDFIVRRELSKPPLDKKIIEQRLAEWPNRAKEIKYVHKASPKFRERYRESSVEERAKLLIRAEQAFYEKYGELKNVENRTLGRPGRHQPSAVEIAAERSGSVADGLQNLRIGDVANHGQARSAGQPDGAQLLPSDAYVHLGQQNPGGDPGLRPALRERGRGGDRGRGRRSAVSETATTGGGAGARNPGPGESSRKRLRSGRRAGDVAPPFVRSLNRVRSIQDVENRGRRLFDPLHQAGGDALGIEVDPSFLPAKADVTSKPVPAKRRKPRPLPARKGKDQVLPPHARNPYKVATVGDIEARGRRLFEPLKKSVGAELLFKLATRKQIAINKSASTVAAYFSRQKVKDTLLPTQRRAIQQIDRRFFEIRRSVFSDDRLTRVDKKQLISVLTFERLKAREAVNNPDLHKEATYMGSAEIRGLVKETTEEEKNPAFSISGPGAAVPTPVRDRVKRILRNITHQVDPKASKEREDELSAKDIYTKKARFSQNVHYIDKKTDRTLFVDTGTAIALRRTGITEAGVSVALGLARERFGSTLTINGTAEFKRLVIEAAAKGKMDIHFTDKAMNDSLKARRQELEIESEGQAIAQPVPEASAPAPSADPATAAADPAAPAPVAHGATNVILPDDSAPSFIRDREAKYRQEMGGLTEQDVRESSTMMELRGADHATWLVASNDFSPAAEAMMSSYMEDPFYREEFKSTMETIYEVAEQSPETLAALEPALDLAAKMVNRIERNLKETADLPLVQVGAEASRANAEAQHARALADGKGLTGEIELMYALGATAADIAEQLGNKLVGVVETDRINFVERVADTLGIPSRAPDADPAAFVTWKQEREARVAAAPVTTSAPASPAATPDRKVIQGELLEHGPAPYQNKPANGASYFVTLKTETGNRTVWGTALEEVMQNEHLKPGENIKLQDHGTVPVVIQVQGPDGNSTPKDAVRRQWSAELVTTTSDAATSKAPNGATPIVLTHNSQPITVDPSNAADVAKYTDQLTNEVTHQRDSIERATQRVGMLENMRDNHSADRGPEYISQINAEIARSKSHIAGSEAIIGKAEAGLQQLGALPSPSPAAAASIPTQQDREEVATETLVATEPVIVETVVEEEYGPEMN